MTALSLMAVSALVLAAAMAAGEGAANEPNRRVKKDEMVGEGGGIDVREKKLDESFFCRRCVGFLRERRKGVVVVLGSGFERDFVIPGRWAGQVIGNLSAGL